MNSYLRFSNFGAIAKEYRASRETYHDRHIDFCVQQKTLSDAIETAARAVDDYNKIHSHQRRVGRTRLDAFAQRLKREERKIRNAQTFDELLHLLEDLHFEGVGELTTYDTATRIGAYLDLFPDKIYLHTGTRVGAENLFGSLKGRKYLLLDELPKEFLRYELSAYEFEDIFCHFKDYFKNPLDRPARKIKKPIC